MKEEEALNKIDEFNTNFLKQYFASEEYFNISKEENLKIIELFNKDYIERGKILLYFATIEYHFNKYIEYHYSDNINVKKLTSLNFDRRIYLLKKKGATDTFLNSILELKDLRNKFAHHLHFQIKKGDMTHIINFLNEDRTTILTGDEDPIPLIQEYSVQACGFLLTLYGNTYEHFLKKQKEALTAFCQDLINNGKIN